MKTDNNVTENQPLIDWDQIREDALKWGKKKWEGKCCTLTFTCGVDVPLEVFLVFF